MLGDDRLELERAYQEEEFLLEVTRKGLTAFIRKELGMELDYDVVEELVNDLIEKFASSES